LLDHFRPVSGVFHGPRLSAATLTWTNTLGGNWSVAANWSPHAVPGAADTANITTAGTYTVTLDANATVTALTLGRPAANRHLPSPPRREQSARRE